MVSPPSLDESVQGSYVGDTSEAYKNEKDNLNKTNNEDLGDMGREYDSKIKTAVIDQELMDTLLELSDTWVDETWSQTETEEIIKEVVVNKAVTNTSEASRTFDKKDGVEVLQQKIKGEEIEIMCQEERL